MKILSKNFFYPCSNNLGQKKKKKKKRKTGNRIKKKKKKHFWRFLKKYSFLFDHQYRYFLWNSLSKNVYFYIFYFFFQVIANNFHQKLPKYVHIIPLNEQNNFFFLNLKLYILVNVEFSEYRVSQKKKKKKKKKWWKWELVISTNNCSIFARVFCIILN